MSQIPEESLEQTDAIVEPEVATEETETEPADSVAEPTAHPRLIVKRNGALTEDIFELHPPATIGRFDPSVGPVDIDLGAIPEGSYVSRKHAKIVFENDQWMLIDLGSSNGTYILRDDFEKIEQSELKDGDEIALGNARFIFQLS